MRFNKSEVAALALGQPSHKFEKEGVLFVKEKQEGFFRRSESKLYFSFSMDLSYLFLSFVFVSHVFASLFQNRQVYPIQSTHHPKNPKIFLWVVSLQMEAKPITVEILIFSLTQC